MLIATYNELKTIVEDSPEGDIRIDASPFIEFNNMPGGYYELEDEEFQDAFAGYADAMYMRVYDIEETDEWALITSDDYVFAVPYDGEFEYEIDPWENS